MTEITTTEAMARMGFINGSSAKIPDGYLKTADLPNSLSNYANLPNYSGNSQIIGLGVYTANFGNVTTPGYYGNSAVSQYSGYVTSLFISLQTAQTVTFAVGILDQYLRFVARYTFQVVCVAGDNQITGLLKDIQATETVFVQTPVNGLRYAVNSSSIAYHNTVASDPLSTLASTALAFSFTVSEVIPPALLPSSTLTTINNNITQLGFNIQKPRTRTSPDGTVWQEKITVDNAGAATYSWVKAVPNRMLFIGNSITKHPIASDANGPFWWGVWGMAASTRNNDYVHQLANMITAVNPAFTFDYIYPQTWEAGYTDPTNFNYAQWDAQLASFNPDYIIIALGENIPTVSTAIGNYWQALIANFQTKCPNARILVRNVFFAAPDKESMIAAAAAARGVPCIATSQLNIPANRSAIGAIVQGDDGLSHTVNNSGVAAHPGDAGMLAIAQLLFNNL